MDVRRGTEQDGLICEPFGGCEQCPEAAMHQPFCKPFGNRQLVHCRAPESTSGEIPAWTWCGRIEGKEKGDFLEFVGCNAVLAVIGLVVVFWRRRVIASQRRRKLAARIGL